EFAFLQTQPLDAFGRLDARGGRTIHEVLHGFAVRRLGVRGNGLGEDARKPDASDDLIAHDPSEIGASGELGYLGHSPVLLLPGAVVRDGPTGIPMKLLGPDDTKSVEVQALTLVIAWLIGDYRRQLELARGGPVVPSSSQVH